MIYFLNPDHVSKGVIETNEYNDKNDQLWRVTYSENYLYLRYFGSWELNQSHFVFLLPNAKALRIKNTGVIRFDVNSFDFFYNVRELVKEHYTYEIWEQLEYFLYLRLEKGGRILESELGT